MSRLAEARGSAATPLNHIEIEHERLTVEIDQNMQEKYQYKLLSVTVNDNTVVRPGRLTVLVGPNNAGKSRALKDIASLTTLQNPLPSVVVSAVEVNYP